MPMLNKDKMIPIKVPLGISTILALKHFITERKLDGDLPNLG